jgi:hypothetical protein
MQDQPPPGVNRFVWILAESQRIRESAADREKASIQRIEAKTHGHAQERQAQQSSPWPRGQG